MRLSVLAAFVRRGISMNQYYCHSIEKWIEQYEERIIASVKRLVSINSVAEPESDVKPYGQGCRKVQSEFCQLAKDFGYTCTSYDDRVIRVDARQSDANRRPDIGIWGHLDVVPAGHDWKYKPFAPVIDKGFLIGRGVRDDKGPAVAALYALKCLQDLRIEQKHHISLYLGLEEEKGMSDVLWLKEHDIPFPKMNLVLDSRYPVCYGEKGILSIVVGGREPLCENLLSLSGGESENSVAGRARMEIRTLSHAPIPKELPDWLAVTSGAGKIAVEAQGLSKHAAHPENSENAIYRLFAAASGTLPGCESLHRCLADALAPGTIKLFRDFAQLSSDIYGEGLEIAAQDEISGKLTTVASLLSMEDRLCSVTFNIRYPIALGRHDPLISAITRTLQKHDMQLVRFSGKTPGYSSKDHPLLVNLMNTYNAFTGQSAHPFTIAGGTYARMLPNGFGYGFRLEPEPVVPAGLFPPGHGGAHAADEAVNVAHYKKQLALLILSLAECQKVAL